MIDRLSEGLYSWFGTFVGAVFSVHFIIHIGSISIYFKRDH